MKRFSEQFHKKATTVKLQAAEKRELRERVVSYMEYHPLPKAAQTKTAEKHSLRTEEYRMVAFPWRALARWSMATAAIFILILPVAAERSVPGDGLYGVKRFNEEVRSTLSLDAVQKVEWETERLNRRIAEARLLANEGRLTEEVEAAMAAAVRTQGQNVQKNIDELRSEDADEATLASLALETTLSVQSAAFQEDESDEMAIMALIDEAHLGNNPSALAAAVEETRAAAAVKNASSTIPVFEKLIARVEINTTRVIELRDSLVDVASEEQVNDITRRIEDVDRAIAEAMALRGESDETARALLIEVLQRTHKMIVFMTDIEVSQTVDIESIIPVVLTEEEKQTVLKNLEQELNENLSHIEAALPEVEDESLLDKSDTVLAEIEQIMSDFNSSTTDDYKSDKVTVESALSLARNLFTVLEIDIAPQTPVTETGSASSTDVAASSTETVAEEDVVDEAGQTVSSTATTTGETSESPAPTTTASSTGSDLSTENVDTSS